MISNFYWNFSFFWYFYWKISYVSLGIFKFLDVFYNSVAVLTEENQMDDSAVQSEIITIDNNIEVIINLDTKSTFDILGDLHVSSSDEYVCEGNIQDSSLESVSNKKKIMAAKTILNWQVTGKWGGGAFQKIARNRNENSGLILNYCYEFISSELLLIIILLCLQMKRCKY